MAEGFKKINIRELNESPVKMIDGDWALLTAGSPDSYNGMTVSWGGIGEIWNMDAAFVFVRPQRYTFEFIEKNEFFTLSFFDGKKKKELGFFGSKSGRDFNKFQETGLTPAFDGDAVYAKEASVVLICRKAAFTDLNPEGFLDKSIFDMYSPDDYHRMYIGQIVKTLVK